MCKEGIRIGRRTNYDTTRGSGGSAILGTLLKARADRVGITVACSWQPAGTIVDTFLLTINDGTLIRTIAALTPGQPTLYLPVERYGVILLGPISAVIQSSVVLTYDIYDHYLDQRLEDI